MKEDLIMDPLISGDVPQSLLLQYKLYNLDVLLQNE